MLGPPEGGNNVWSEEGGSKSNAPSQASCSVYLQQAKTSSSAEQIEFFPGCHVGSIETACHYLFHGPTLDWRGVEVGGTVFPRPPPPPLPSGPPHSSWLLSGTD